MIAMGKQSTALVPVTPQPLGLPAMTWAKGVIVSAIEDALSDLDPAERADHAEIRRLYCVLVALLGPDEAAAPFVSSCGTSSLWRIAEAA